MASIAATRMPHPAGESCAFSMACSPERKSFFQRLLSMEANSKFASDDALDSGSLVSLVGRLRISVCDSSHESRTMDNGDANDIDRATADASSGDEAGVKNGEVIRLCAAKDCPVDEHEKASFACIGDASPSDNTGDGTGSDGAAPAIADGNSGDNSFGDGASISVAESDDIALNLISAGDVVAAIEGSISEENDG